MRSKNPTRAQLFNFYAASILVKLADEFPVERKFAEKDFGFDYWENYNPDKPLDKFDNDKDIFYGTLKFLVCEGYVRTPHKLEELDKDENLYLSLTLKGLTHLNFRFEVGVLEKKRPLSDALSDALKKPENWVVISNLLEKVFNYE